MDWQRLGPGTSANNMSDANTENPGQQRRTTANEPMPKASLTSKRLREPEEEGKNTLEKKKKKMK